MSVFLALLLTLRNCARSRAVLQLEVLALRHQLQVLQRSRPLRVRLVKTDRRLWIWLSRVWTEWRPALVIVKPETVVAWHRRGFRWFWTWKSRQRTGRPTVAAEMRVLIRTMSQANTRWGAPRIHGELLKLSKDAPIHRAIAMPSHGRVVAIPQAGGLHHGTNGRRPDRDCPVCPFRGRGDNLNGESR